MPAGSYGLLNCLRITVGDEASCRRVAHVIGRFMETTAQDGSASAPIYNRVALIGLG